MYAGKGGDGSKSVASNSDSLLGYVAVSRGEEGQRGMQVEYDNSNNDTIKYVKMHVISLLGFGWQC